MKSKLIKLQPIKVIDENYLRYLWIDSLQHTQDKIIYIPTEAGMPLLEAGKR
jgi:hypothetical protein